MIPSRARIAVALLTLVVGACRDGLAPLPPGATLAVRPDAVRLLPGDTLRLRISARSAGGDSIATPAVSWSSSDTAVVRVDGGGLLRGGRPGLASVMARSGNVSASADVQVLAAAAADCGAGAPADTDRIIDRKTTWRRADGPFRLPSGVYVQAPLTIEAGTLVCVGPGFPILISPGASVLAAGTAAAPVIFTALDPAHPWGGFVPSAGPPPASGGGSVTLRHAVIENATAGVALDGATVDSTRFRQIAGRAFFGAGRLVSSVVDTCGTAELPAVELNGGTMENSVVRGARGIGVQVDGYLGGTIRGGRIEGSGGIGLAAPEYKYLGNRVSISGTPRITGGRGRTLVLPLEAFLTGWPTREAQDRLLGNAGDTVSLYAGGTLHGDVLVRADLPWSIGPTQTEWNIPPQVEGTLRLEPGASLRGLIYASRVLALGTAGRPAEISAEVGLTGGAADTSRLVHTRVLGGGIWTDSTHALAVENSYFGPGTGLLLRAPGSRISGSVAQRMRAPAPSLSWSPLQRGVTIALAAPGVRLERTVALGAMGPGVRVTAPGVTLSDCTITLGTDAGVSVASAGSDTIRNCNLEANAGPGVDAKGGSSVDARGNWWGDPAGPNGAAGDGVAGNADVGGWLTAPATWPDAAAVAAVSLTLPQATVASSDTVRPNVLARDAAGNPLPPEVLAWRFSDPHVARYDAPTGVLVGLSPGTATVTAVARSDATRRATATLTVVPGAPTFLWSSQPLLGLVPGATRPIPLGMWGVAPDDVWATSTDGVLHYDGSGWSLVSHGATVVGVPGIAGSGIAGTAADRIYAVGDAGQVARFDGATWTRFPGPPTSAWLTSVALAGGDSIYVGGRTTFRANQPVLPGGVWLWDGSAWSSVLDRPGAVIRAAGRVYTTADDSRILRRDAGGWTDIGPLSGFLCGTPTALYQLSWNGAQSRAFARFDGSAWTTLPPGPATSEAIGCVGEAVVAVGKDGMVQWFDGSSWRTVFSGLPAELDRVFAVQNQLFLTAALPGDLYDGLLVHAVPVP